MTSSSPDPIEVCRLSVHTEHPAVTVTVMDHAWSVVATGFGSFSVELPLGVYKIEARLGRDGWTGYVALRDGPATVEVPPFGIKSAVPLSAFTRSHEYHEEEFSAARARTDRSEGSGSRILIVARNWSPDGAASYDLPRIRLERWRGDVLADLQADGRVEQRGDSVATCAVEVNAGDYVLTIKTDIGGISQAVYALPGWETQVFILQDFTSQRSSTESSVARTTFTGTMAIVHPNETRQRHYELLEAGQMAISERRLALGNSVFDEIAAGKWQSPVLGLLAAHILLVAAGRSETRKREGAELIQFDREQFEIILGNTAKLIGEDQPDIIALRTRSKAMALPEEAEVASPPIFWRSWELLLRANTSERPGLIRDNLWRRVRGNANFAPFFTWSRADNAFALQRRAVEDRLVRDFSAATAERSAGSEASRSPGREGLALENVDSQRSKKPDLSELAAYAPQPELNRIATDSDSGQSAIERIAQYTRVPYSFAEKILDPEAANRRRPRKRK